MIPSVTIDSSLQIKSYNEAFVANIIPEKMTLGYNILHLFDESDKLELQDAFEKCRLDTGPFATVSGKKLTTIASQPTAFPIRSEYNCIISYVDHYRQLKED